MTVEALSVVYTYDTQIIHLITITGGVTTDRLLQVDQPLGVLDANRRIALIVISHATQLATLDLNTGAIRTLDVNSSGNLGGAVLSPDGSEAAVAVRHADLASYEIRIVDLSSGASHVLLQIPADAYNRAGLDLITWSNGGILVSPGVWDGPRFRLLDLDPNSGNLTPITDAQVDALSSDSAIMAAASHTDLGDAQFEGQGVWPNRLTGGPVGGPQSVIAEQKNRAFSVLDVENDGSVLYVADDAPLATRQPAQDMGLYLATGGTSIEQLGETHTGQWQAAEVVGPGQALVVQQVTGGEKGVVEIDLMSLCTSLAGCTPSIQAVETDPGRYPYGRLILLTA